MGPFAQDFKNYESYRNDDYYRKTVPDGLCDSLANLFASMCGDIDSSETVGKMVSIASDLLVMAGRKASNKSDIVVLKTEIKATFQILCEMNFSRFMDATRIAAERLYKEMPPSPREDFLKKINRALIDKNFGYTIRKGVDDSDTLVWEARWKAEAGLVALAAATESLGEGFPEAIEHINQAKDHLLRPDEPRSRKDSVRDAMSSMEAMLKKLANENDIKTAVKKLRDERYWGKNKVVRDALSIWHYLHDEYPDIRHGQTSGSDIELDEALYWIGRITVYIRYMIDRKKAIGR